MKIEAKEGTTYRAVLDAVLTIDCPYVVNVQEVLEDDTYFYTVMETCNGGELFDFLETADEVAESKCKRFIREILEGLDALHRRGVIHRDIKPENVLMHRDPSSSHRILKIADFGIAALATKQCKSDKIVGTYGYIAPEGYLGLCSAQSDLWAVGVVLYHLITGGMPYSWGLYPTDDDGISPEVGRSVFQALHEAEIDWQAEWPEEFPAARDLCEWLLEFATSDRCPSAREALEHPWLSSGAAKAKAKRAKGGVRRASLPGRVSTSQTSGNVVRRASLGDVPVEGRSTTPDTPLPPMLDGTWSN
jgi:serine/threonine protein kinase